MTAITLINKLTPTGLTIKEALIIAERAEAIEAAAMRIKRESVGAKIYTLKEISMRYLNQLKRAIEASLQNIDNTEKQYGDLSVREFCKIQKENLLSEYKNAKEAWEREQIQIAKKREAQGMDTSTRSKQ